MFDRIKWKSWYEWQKWGTKKNANLFEKPLGRGPIYKNNYRLSIVCRYPGVPEIIFRLATPSGKRKTTMKPHYGHISYPWPSRSEIYGLSSMGNHEQTQNSVYPAYTVAVCPSHHIGKMYFSQWKPPGLSERMCSVKFDVSISREYQTLGWHSGRPSE
jgi:hypothetical protein